MRSSGLFCAVAALAACTPRPEAKPRADPSDPALASALADPIMVDPQLGAQANTDTIRPPDEPFQAELPKGAPGDARGGAPVTLALRLRAAAMSAGAESPFADCNPAVAYGLAWSIRLPDAFALPSGAQIAEAAGTDGANCRLRLISYTIAAPPMTVLGHYRAVARSGGFTVRETGSVLAARRPSDGAAFVATVTARDDTGSSVDLMVNRGR